MRLIVTVLHPHLVVILDTLVGWMVLLGKDAFVLRAVTDVFLYPVRLYTWLGKAERLADVLGVVLVVYVYQG